ncbi:MAG: hypothetical protein AB7N76_34525 [Planctomycetota bacterium]
MSRSSSGPARARRAAGQGLPRQAAWLRGFPRGPARDGVLPWLSPTALEDEARPVRLRVDAALVRETRRALGAVEAREGPATGRGAEANTGQLDAGGVVEGSSSSATANDSARASDAARWGDGRTTRRDAHATRRGAARDELALLLRIDRARRAAALPSAVDLLREHGAPDAALRQAARWEARPQWGAFARALAWLRLPRGRELGRAFELAAAHEGALGALLDLGRQAGTRGLRPALALVDLLETHGERRLAPVLALLASTPASTPAIGGAATIKALVAFAEGYLRRVHRGAPRLEQRRAQRGARALELPRALELAAPLAGLLLELRRASVGEARRTLRAFGELLPRLDLEARAGWWREVAGRVARVRRLIARERRAQPPSLAELGALVAALRARREDPPEPLPLEPFLETLRRLRLRPTLARRLLPFVRSFAPEERLALVDRYVALAARQGEKPVIHLLGALRGERGRVGAVAAAWLGRDLARGYDLEPLLRASPVLRARGVRALATYAARCAALPGGPPALPWGLFCELARADHRRRRPAAAAGELLAELACGPGLPAGAWLADWRACELAARLAQGQAARLVAVGKRLEALSLRWDDLGRLIHAAREPAWGALVGDALLEGEPLEPLLELGDLASALVLLAPSVSAPSLSGRSLSETSLSGPSLSGPDLSGPSPSGPSLSETTTLPAPRDASATSPLPTWVAAYPAPLHDLLLALAQVDRRAERSAARALGRELPPRAALVREVAGLSARIAAGGGGEGRIERLCALRARLRDEVGAPLAPGKLRRCRARLEARLLRARLAALQERALTRLRELLQAQVPGLPDVWLACARTRGLLLALAGLEDEHARALGLRLLRARLGPRPWDLRDEPRNARFVRRLVRNGLDPLPWQDGIGTHVRAGQDGSVVLLALEDDPLEVLHMGGHFGTCLSPDRENFFSAVGNAADLNKRVLYARTPQGRVVGRCLLALTARGDVLAYHPYAHDGGLGMDELVADFVRELARQIGGAPAGVGRPETLLAKEWYDDGEVDVCEVERVFEDAASPARKALADLDPAELEEHLSRAVAPRRLDARAVGRALALPELTARPTLVLGLWRWLERLAPRDRLRATELLHAAGRQEEALLLARRLARRAARLPREVLQPLVAQLGLLDDDRLARRLARRLA